MATISTVLGDVADRDADADERRRRAPPPRRGRVGSGARVRVAIVGGTGDFGLALARRLVEAGDEVVLGLAMRPRAQGESGGSRAPRSGRSKRRCGRGVELVVLATNASATLETAAALRRTRSGDTPVLSVASDLRSTEHLSLAERTQELLAGPSSPASNPLAAGKLARGRPTRTPSSAATSRARRRSRSSSRGRRRGPRARRRPARPRPRPRRL
jgi:hypothetical protein